MNEDIVLPPAYAPFRPVLELLSKPLAMTLCGQLQQFEPFARGLELKEFAFQGEFEGLGGLTHHGEIDHILQSELLLRTEAPLEFLRRLAESEMLYHDRIFADPGARKVWRVIISAGPDILGHGRLIALAALFFLARVAAVRGAEFHWSFLPRVDGAVWFTELSVNTIKRFLRSAAFREADANDIAAARESWGAAKDEVTVGSRPELADWIIGSARDWGTETSMVSTQRNAISFVLQPPVPGEPRRATITVRRNGHELRRSTTELADDRQCLSALEKPFATPPRDRAMGNEKACVPNIAGWEPRYLSTLTGRHLAVRLPDGVLITEFHENRLTDGRWFLPLAKDSQLVGITIEDGSLCVLRHRTVKGEQRLIYHQFRLIPGQNQSVSHRITHTIPSEHLFQNRPPFALPSMAVTGDVEFYSTSGNAYRLNFPEGSAAKFTTLYRNPRIVLSTGVHHVAQLIRDERAVLQVFRQGRTAQASFTLSDYAELPKSFHAIAWSSAEGAMAFALEPQRWQVAAADDAERRSHRRELEFEVERYERVILAGEKRDGVHAVVWSDAALGGEGMIDFLHFTNGRRQREQVSLNLGEYAAAIRVILRIGGKFWAVLCDQHGHPEQLVFYPYTKRDHARPPTYRRLAELKDRAARLDFEGED